MSLSRYVYLRVMLAVFFGVPVPLVHGQTTPGSWAGCTVYSMGGGNDTITWLDFALFGGAGLPNGSYSITLACFGGICGTETDSLITFNVGGGVITPTNGPHLQLTHGLNGGNSSIVLGTAPVTVSFAYKSQAGPVRFNCGGPSFTLSGYTCAGFGGFTPVNGTTMNVFVSPCSATSSTGVNVQMTSQNFSNSSYYTGRGYHPINYYLEMDFTMGGSTIRMRSDTFVAGQGAHTFTGSFTNGYLAVGSYAVSLYNSADGSSRSLGTAVIAADCNTINIEGASYPFPPPPVTPTPTPYTTPTPAPTTTPGPNSSPVPTPAPNGAGTTVTNNGVTTTGTPGVGITNQDFYNDVKQAVTDAGSGMTPQPGGGDATNPGHATSDYSNRGTIDSLQSDETQWQGAVTDGASAASGVLSGVTGAIASLPSSFGSVSSVALPLSNLNIIPHGIAMSFPSTIDLTAWVVPIGVLRTALLWLLRITMFVQTLRLFTWQN